MALLEEFTRDEKKILYIVLPKFISSAAFHNGIETIRRAIEMYPENSLYTIVNIEYAIFDSKIIKHFVYLMQYNKRFIKYSVITGFDGIKKAICTSIAKKSGRTNIGYAFTKELAIELLLQLK